MRQVFPVFSTNFESNLIARILRFPKAVCGLCLQFVVRAVSLPFSLKLRRTTCLISLLTAFDFVRLFSPSELFQGAGQSNSSFISTSPDPMVFSGLRASPLGGEVCHTTIKWVITLPRCLQRADLLSRQVLCFGKKQSPAGFCQ